MKRTTRNVVAILLAVAMCMVMSASAFATEEKVIVPLNPEELVEYYEVLSEMPPVDIGTPETAEYDNSPNIQTRASGFLFSMEAKAVHDLLVTGAEKTFTDYDLDNGYLHITGHLEHTEGPDAKIKIGGCWYNSTTGTYKADLYKYVYASKDIGVTIPTLLAIAKEYTHRGFIKNEYGEGIVTGNLSFYSKE